MYPILSFSVRQQRFVADIACAASGMRTYAALWHCTVYDLYCTMHVTCGTYVCAGGGIPSIPRDAVYVRRCPVPGVETRSAAWAPIVVLSRDNVTQIVSITVLRLAAV